MSAPTTRPDTEIPPALVRAVFIHLGVFVVFSSWAFGGQSHLARQAIAWWGTAGIVLFVLAAWKYPAANWRRHPAVRCLWPLVLFDILAIASCFNPGFRTGLADGVPTLVMIQPIRGLPTSAIPEATARELWQFNGLVLSAFNLMLVATRRRQLRALLFVLAGNAVALAVFGTFQKLVGASGLWFGSVPSPNQHFFATFIYHNHWGSFALLALGACLGLIFHYQRRGDARSRAHSPLLLGALATLLLATSIPLSTSRSSTALAVVLLLGALGHLLARIVRRRRAEQRSAAAPVAALLLAALLAAGGIAYLGRTVIAQRAQLTSQQLVQLGHEGTLTSRLVLYRDTWRMAAAKPWFGWGLESYARVFRIFNTQRAAEGWVWIPYYAEAHNDWLQALAEVGFVGTGLLLLLGFLPLRAVPWRQTRSLVPVYLLAGCSLLLVYAWLEFPFANPAVVLGFCVVFYGGVRYAELDAALSRHG